MSLPQFRYAQACKRGVVLHFHRFRPSRWNSVVVPYPYGINDPEERGGNPADQIEASYRRLPELRGRPRGPVLSSGTQRAEQRRPSTGYLLPRSSGRRYARVPITLMALTALARINHPPTPSMTCF
jgi:hypothetical protein